MEKSILLPLILLCLHASSQAFVSGEAGTRLGINAGYIYNRVVAKAGGLFFYKRDAAKSSVAYAGLGYQIGKTISVTPLVGISYYKVTDFTKWHEGGDPIEINNTIPLLSLEIAKDLETSWRSPYRIYMFVTHAEKAIFGAGLRIFIQ